MSTALIIIIVLSIIGIGNTSYLTYCKLKQKPVLCLFFPPEWCRTVQKSKYSKTFGIPNAFAGLGMYVALLVLAILFFYGLIPVWPLYAIITFGFLFSFYFLGIQGFVLKAFCTWCVLSAIEFLALFATMFFL